MPHRMVRSIVEQQQIIFASAQISVTEAARLMKQAKIGALIVVEGKRLIGIFTERDALFRVLAEQKNPHTTLVADVMTPNPQTIHPDKPFGHALHMMFEGGFRHVPVVENGLPVGILSARDALGPDLQAFESELRQREHIVEILG